jgi:hypothetical protein
MAGEMRSQAASKKLEGASPGYLMHSDASDKSGICSTTAAPRKVNPFHLFFYSLKECFR